MRYCAFVLCMFLMTHLAKAGYIFDTITSNPGDLGMLASDAGPGQSFIIATEAGQPFTASAYTGIGSIVLPVEIWTQPDGPSGGYGNGSINVTMNVRSVGDPFVGGTVGAPIWSQTQTLNFGPAYNNPATPTTETLTFTTNGGLAAPANVPLLYSLQINSYSSLPNVLLEQNSSTAASSLYWANLANGGWTYMGYANTGAQMSLAAQSLVAGDINGDFTVDARDILGIQSAGKYGKSIAATWKDGDFDGDGLVTAKDILLVQSSNAYNKGTYATSYAKSAQSSARPSHFDSLPMNTAELVYNPMTGDVQILAQGNAINGAIVDSVSGQFIPNSAMFPSGSTFNESTASEIATFKFGSSFGDWDFGSVLPANLPLTTVESDLSGSYTLDGETGTRTFAVTSTPEPSTIALALCSLPILLRRKRLTGQQ